MRRTVVLAWLSNHSFFVKLIIALANMIKISRKRFIQYVLCIE